jgi:hypothetical protein
MALPGQDDPLLNESSGGRLSIHQRAAAPSGFFTMSSLQADRNRPWYFGIG